MGLTGLALQLALFPDAELDRPPAAPRPGADLPKALSQLFRCRLMIEIFKSYISHKKDRHVLFKGQASTLVLLATSDVFQLLRACALSHWPKAIFTKHRGWHFHSFEL